MPRKNDRSHFFSYVLTIVLALVRWGVVRTWNVLTFWKKERKKPLPERQKVDRAKAFAGLLAIAAGLGIAAWFVLKIMFIPAIAEIAPRQAALYIGAVLITIGLQIARRSAKRRKLGLLFVALGVLLCAFGLGHLG